MLGSNIASFLSTFTVFVLIFSLIVFIHEFGHYFFAIKNGVFVEQFSIGFGPVVFGRKDKKGTFWSLRAIPLGGYVKMFGDEDVASVVQKTDMTEEEKKKSIISKTPLQKILISLGGPLFNYVTGIFFMFVVLFFFGKITHSNRLIDVLDDSPARVAGLKIGDEIIGINGVDITTFDEVLYYMSKNNGEVLTFKYKRGDKVDSVDIKPVLKDNERYIVGFVTEKYIKKSFGLFGALTASCHNAWSISKNSVIGLFYLFNKKKKSSLYGPIRMAQFSRKVASSGFVPLLDFIGFISISLGFVNLLPIPVLDGGSIVVNFVELIRRKKISEKTHLILFYIGLPILLSLMIYALYGDILSLFKK